ncbi:Uncharacterized protein SCF082_LOCUS30355, partial [Durusdinium trenchii]
MVFGLPDLEINKSHELQHVELFAGQCAEGRAAIAMDLEIGGPTMDLTTNEGFLAALYHTCRLKPGSGWLAAPVCHDIVEDVDDFRPRWLPPREAVEMAVVYQDGRGVTRVKGGRHLKASQAYPLGFGKALSAVRNRHAARIRCEAREPKAKASGLKRPAEKVKKEGKEKKAKCEPKEKKKESKKESKKEERKKEERKKVKEAGVKEVRKSALKQKQKKVEPIAPGAPEKRVRFKSPMETPPPTCSRSTPDPSPTPSSAQSLENFKQLAADRGMSVEEFMEEMSAKCLEAQVDARMQQLATEHPAPPTDDEEEEVERPKGKKGEDVKKPGEGDEEEDEGDGEDEMSSLSEDASESDGPDGSVDSEEEEEVSSEEEEGEDGDEGEDDSEEEEEAQEEAAVEKDFTKLLDDADEDETQKGVKDKKKKEEEKPNAEKLKDAVVKGEEDFSKANSARDLYKKYPKEKADLLMKKLKEKGMWHYDPDFEGDEEEIFYYASEDNVMSDESIFRDITKVKGREDSKEVVEALTGEGGCWLLAHAGQKAMTEALTGSSVSAAPKPKPKRDKEVEKMEPKTVIEQAQDHMDSCLKKAADARKHAISLGGTGYGGDLSTQLMNFQFQNGSCLQVSEEEKYAKHFQLIVDKIAWYEKAE